MLAGCGPQIPQDASVEDKVGFAADYFNENKASQMGALANDMSAYADGTALVLRIENAPGGNRTVDPQWMSKQLRPMICKDDNFKLALADGVKIRMEIVSDTGKVSPPVTIAYCGPAQ